MKVLLAGSVSPLSAREELHWVEAISNCLREKGHQVDWFTLPIVQDPLLLAEQFMALRLLSVDPGADLLITVGYPAFALKHPRKKAVLFSLASPLQEWFDSEYGVLATPQYHSIRRSIKMAEKKCLAESERIICGSAILAKIVREEYKLGTGSYILDDVLEDKNGTDLPAGEIWVISESTLEPFDRFDLLIDAVATSFGQWKLAIYIPSASEVYESTLLQRVEKLAIKDRILIKKEPLSMEALEKSTLYITLPYRSTRISEGIIRAVKSNKPIVTLSDSGAPLEMVRNNVNGLITEPSAKSIARTLDQVCKDAAILKKLSGGALSLATKIVNTERLVRELIG